MTEQRAIRAWARRWYIDGEVPKKERNEKGRMAWPRKFIFKEVTKHKVFSDDVPLYYIKEASE